jgi:hypothetical protein
MEQNEITSEVAVQVMKEQKKASHVYDIKTMSVVAFGGHKFTYDRYVKEIAEIGEVLPIPDEILLYTLKGFIDDLQDSTASIKKGDYKKTPEGEDMYRIDCLNKRRELEGHINAGTRPTRVNATADPETAIMKAKVKELKTSFDYKQLAAMKLLGLPMTVEQKTKLNEFENMVEEAG